MTTTAQLARLAQLSSLIRYHMLRATTEAGSGHPTSSLSAVELMAGLMFGGFFRYDLDRPDHPNNDRLHLLQGPRLAAVLRAVAGRGQGDAGGDAHLPAVRQPARGAPDAPLPLHRGRHGLARARGSRSAWAWR